MLCIYAVRYVTAYLKEINLAPHPLYQKLVERFCYFGIFLVCINMAFPFLYAFDANNRYYRLPGISITFGIAFFCLTLIAVMCMRYRQSLGQSAKALFAYAVLPTVSVLAQGFLYGLSLVNLGITAPLVMLYVVHQKERVRQFREQTLLMAQQKEELTSQRIELMTSQIQPHFIFNSLATISCLCTIDPNLAEEATNRFAQYLRMNLDTLGKSTRVPFRQEMEHTKTYLWLEKLRFEDSLNIEYDVDDSIDFILPPLTLQPIVENAVKHGICKKRGGGTVRISVQAEPTGHRIIVEDDGVGFDPNVPPKDGRSHVGMVNTRERLRHICDGEMTIESQVGVGTKVEIFIPN